MSMFSEGFHKGEGHGRFGTTERGRVLGKFAKHCLKESNETDVVSVDSLQSTAKKEQKGKFLGKIIRKNK